MEQLRLEGASGDNLVQTSSSKQGQSQLRALSSLIFSISKDGHSTMSLSSLFQCLTPLQKKKKKVFLVLNRITCILICAHCLLSCSLEITEKSCLYPASIRYLYTLTRSPRAFSSSLSISSYERCSNVLITFRLFRGLRFPKTNLNSKD